MNDFYEKAIAAYQFQVNRYHTWMNYYSLFHGALLVALYSVSCSCEAYNKEYLIAIITSIGYGAALCWIGTVEGNRKWINHWMDIVKEQEEILNTENGRNDLQVYQRMPNAADKNFLSTQRIMLAFTIIVAIGWIAVGFVNDWKVAIVPTVIITVVGLWLYLKGCLRS